MVDMVLSLDRRGHRGKITALSSRGLLSLPHRPVKPFPVAAEEVPFGAELSELSAWLRSLARKMASDGGIGVRRSTHCARTRSVYGGRCRSSKSDAFCVTRVRIGTCTVIAWRPRSKRKSPPFVRLGGSKLSPGGLFAPSSVENGIDVEIVMRGGGQPEIGTFARLIDCTGLANDPRARKIP